MSEEKIYVIPLKEAFKKAYAKRTPYAMRHIEKFLETHTKKKKIKIGSHLNEKLWERGIKKPPRKIKVKVILDGDFAKTELFGFEYKEFKIVPKKERKGIRDKLMDRIGTKSIQKNELDKSIEGKQEKSIGDKEKPIVEKPNETKTMDKKAESLL